MQIMLIQTDHAAAKRIRQYISICYPHSLIHVFISAAEAMATIDFPGQHIDLCFIPIRMDCVSGIPIAQKLRQKNKRTKIVYFSDTAEYALDAWHAGANDYLMEPITLESIRHSMDACQ